MQMTNNSRIQGRQDTYTITGSLPAASGGMAAINFARDGRGRDVIIKSPKITGDGNDDLRVDKLKVEAEILKSIRDHAQRNFIVQYLDESPLNNDFFLVLEKVNGKTIREMISENPLAEETALRYFNNLVQALDFLHRQNIIHRDVKPNNIIVDPVRGPVLIDFGAAKHGWTQMVQNDGTVIGTVGWSCPHQFSGGVSTSCDVYSAGAVLFYMLIGKDPKFYMNNAHTLIRPPHQINPTISTKVSAMVGNTIDPEHRRISSIKDMIIPTKPEPPQAAQPYILLGGRKYQLGHEANIGRTHRSCDHNCLSAGYQALPTIQIDDEGNNYISKHHVRIWRDKNGHFWIQDLRSRNGTAIFSNGMYRSLAPGRKEMLNPNSVIALCHNAAKGAYVTFTFHDR